MTASKIKIPVFSQFLKGLTVSFVPQLEGSDCLIEVVYDTREQAMDAYSHFGLLTVRGESLEMDRVFSSDYVEFEKKTPEEMKEYFMHHAKLFE